jgi:hypothetical protein
VIHSADNLLRRAKGFLRSSTGMMAEPLHGVT